MNNTIKNFLIKQGIDTTLDKFDEYIDNNFDFNHIIDKYVIYKNTMSSQISIANIRGDAKSYEETTLSGMSELLGNFFNENGSGYEARSLGMLEYSSEEVVDKLRRSFITDPMYVNECGENSYEIGQNGMHRYHILKFHYLKERLSISPDDVDAIAALDEKYKVDYQVKHVDYTKTYCAYFLDRVKQCDRIFVENEVVDREKTGNSIVTQVIGKESKEQIMDDDSLVNVTRDLLLRFLDSPSPQVQSYLSTWEGYLAGTESFKEFLSIKMPEVLEKINMKLKEKESKTSFDFFNEEFSVSEAVLDNSSEKLLSDDWGYSLDDLL